MDEEQARGLGTVLRHRYGAVASAVPIHTYQMRTIGNSVAPKDVWCVVANGTVIASQAELAP